VLLYFPLPWGEGSSITSSPLGGEGRVRGEGISGTKILSLCSYYFALIKEKEM